MSSYRVTAHTRADSNSDCLYKITRPTQDQASQSSSKDERRAYETLHIPEKLLAVDGYLKRESHYSSVNQPLTYDAFSVHESMIQILQDLGRKNDLVDNNLMKKDIYIYMVIYKHFLRKFCFPGIDRNENC